MRTLASRVNPTRFGGRRLMSKLGAKVARPCVRNPFSRPKRSQVTASILKHLRKSRLLSARNVKPGRLTCTAAYPSTKVHLSRNSLRLDPHAFQDRSTLSNLKHE